MSYVWGVRGTAKRTPLTDALRQELYVAPYDSIDWDAARNQCAKPDLYYPHPKLQVCNRCSGPLLLYDTQFRDALVSGASAGPLPVGQATGA